MTNKEAIQGLLNVKAQMAEKSPFTEAINLAVKALEKQIAKKPVGRHKKCPTCEMIEFGYEEVNYCPHCGQRIDWEGSENNNDDDGRRDCKRF